MSEEELKTELEGLRNENPALKKGASAGHPLEGQRKGSSFDLRHGALSRDLV
jgi:hypothetical protein